LKTRIWTLLSKEKFALAFMVMLLTLFTIVLTYKHYIDYQKYRTELGEEYKNINPDFVDSWPWYDWGIGPYVFMLKFITAGVWIGIIIRGLQKIKFRKHRELKAISLLLIPLIASIPTSKAYPNITSIPTSDTDVDILFAGDEEFMSGYITSTWGDVWLKDLVEIGVPPWYSGIFERVQGYFNDQVGINIVFHGWMTWDSDDEVTNCYYMLQEAIEEIGGTWIHDPTWPDNGYWRFNKGMLWNGVVIDMLVAWTWQDMSRRGLGPFEWGACILKYENFLTDDNAMQHEMSHLYGLLHCGHILCVMNEPFLEFTETWQSSCHDYMVSHKNYFTRHGLAINSNPHGETNPSAGLYYYYNGTRVVLSAVGDTYYFFKKWVYNNTFTSFDNPWTFSVAASWDIYPIFCSIADFDEDGDVDYDDIVYFITAYIVFWSTGVKDPRCDFDNDCDIDYDDKLFFLDRYYEYWNP